MLTLVIITLQSGCMARAELLKIERPRRRRELWEGTCGDLAWPEQGGRDGQARSTHVQVLRPVVVSDQRYLTVLQEAECHRGGVQRTFLAGLDGEGDCGGGQGVIEVILAPTVEHYRVMASRSAGFSATAEISFGKFGQIFRVNHPVVTLAVLRAYRFHKTVVAREIVAHTVAPSRSFLAVEVGIVASDVVVDRA